MCYLKFAPLLALLFLTSTQAEILSQSRQAELNNLLIQDCGSCHGLQRKGGLGPALLPENLKNLPVAVIKVIILEGVSKTAMPPWKALLTENEALYLANELKKPKINKK